MHRITNKFQFRGLTIVNEYDIARNWCQSCGGSNVIGMDDDLWYETVSYCMDCGDGNEQSDSALIELFDRNQSRRIRSNEKIQRRRNGIRDWDYRRIPALSVTPGAELTILADRGGSIPPIDKTAVRQKET